MKYAMIVAAAAMLTLSPALAQQTAPTASLPDQIQALSTELNLTRQALSNSNNSYLAERTQTLIIDNKLSQAQTMLADKDKLIADLKGQLASAAKSEKAAEGNGVPPAGPAPATPPAQPAAPAPGYTPKP